MDIFFSFPLAMIVSLNGKEQHLKCPTVQVVFFQAICCHSILHQSILRE